jgi:hypothetical protein
MLPIDTASTKVVELSTLKPGQFFFHRSGSQFQLGVYLVSDEVYCCWLNLTGFDAFTLARFPARNRERVLRLGISPDTVRLRIEGARPPEEYSDHQMGQLVFDSDLGACIAVQWPDMDPQHYRHIVSVDSWQRGQLATPSGGVINSWALSVVDEAGQWVDLVSR